LDSTLFTAGFSLANVRVIFISFLALVWQLTHSLSDAETEPGDSTTLWIFSSISFFSASSFFSQSFAVPVYKLRVFLLLSYI
jgi:hypothetical protein